MTHPMSHQPPPCGATFGLSLPPQQIVITRLLSCGRRLQNSSTTPVSSILVIIDVSKLLLLLADLGVVERRLVEHLVAVQQIFKHAGAILS